ETAPENPVNNALWLDMSVEPNMLKRWDALTQTWIELGADVDLSDYPTRSEVTSEINQSASSITTQVRNEISGDISEIQQDVSSLTTRVSNAEGDASQALQTANGLSSRVSNAEDDASEALQTANGFSARITNVEGDVSSLELSLSGVVASVEGNRLVFNSNGLT